MDVQNIQASLEEHFGFLKGQVTVKRQGRISMELARESCKDVFAFVITTLGFTALSAITGSEETDCFSVIYHLNKDGRVVLNIKIRLPKDSPVVQTISGLFPCADAYERELIDLLGISVEGLPAGNRYPLPDTWPADEHPLRKGWKSKEVPHA
jgi:membrane-bound hydrogenase subunit beta